jgi:hypothetical protein
VILKLGAVREWTLQVDRDRDVDFGRESIGALTFITMIAGTRLRDVQFDEMHTLRSTRAACQIGQAMNTQDPEPRTDYQTRHDHFDREGSMSLYAYPDRAGVGMCNACIRSM